jgi:anti-sigma factor RsiW
VDSSDRHTLKPWFAGRADVSPVVADFNQVGYPLIGGRAESLLKQRVAVVVYLHGPHVINVFSWVAGREGLPGEVSRAGYHMAFWRAGDLQYCAISDTGWDELEGLVRLLRDLSARDTR